MTRRYLIPFIRTIICIAVLVFPAQAQQFKILVHMTDDQKNYLITQVLPLFEMQYAVKLQVVTYESFNDLESKLDKLKDSVGLVKIPFVKGWDLAASGYVRPLDSFLSKGDIEDFKKVYACWWLGAHDNRIYFIPRKYETHIMAYRPSKTALAAATWKRHAAGIDSLLAKINGFGLPSGYDLENDPARWDFFDLFVVGYVWSRTEYSLVKKPRIAFRGKLYDGTALRLIDRVYECGGDSSSIFNMESKPVVDAYMWEAAYAWGGICDTTMWAGQWSGRELWDAFWKGSIYLSFFTQLDCITILNRESGQGRADIDFATSLVPQGCSITLDKSRKTLRQGGHRVTTGGWWWGIPQQWMDPVTAYRLARFITNRENQVMECKRFGMVPVRNDVIRDPVALFSGGPVSDVFRTSYRQMQENNNCVLPGNKLIDTVSRCYLDAWKRIAVEKQWSEKASMPPKEEYIEAVLKKHFSPRVMKIAAGKK